MNEYNFQVNEGLAIMAFSITDYMSKDDLDRWIDTFGLYSIVVHHESDVFFPKHTVITIQPTSKDLMDLFRLLLQRTTCGKNLPMNEIVIFSSYDNFAKAVVDGKITVTNVNKTSMYKENERKEFILNEFLEYHKINYPSLVNLYGLEDMNIKKTVIKRKAHIFN